MSNDQTVSVAAAVIRREGRLLLTRRPPGGARGLLWEFPGGKVEPGETAEQALVREIDEELAAQALDLEVLEVVRHRYPDGLSVEITFIACRLATESLVPGPGVHEHRWWRVEEIPLDQVLEADRELLIRLGARPARPS